MKIKDYLAKSITWNATKKAEFPYKTVFDGKDMTIRINDFPAEELYTLIVGKAEIGFEDWPEAWTKGRATAAKKAKSFSAVSRSRLAKAL